MRIWTHLCVSIGTVYNSFQCDFAVFPCYRWLSDKEDTTAHCNGRDWSQRTEICLRSDNIKLDPLLNRWKYCLELNLMKQFVTTLDKESAAFMYVPDFFPKLSETKVQRWCLRWPTNKDQSAWNSPISSLWRINASWNRFVAVFWVFLGNLKTENYVELVEILVKNYAKIVCSMFLKVHIADANNYKFKNIEAFSEYIQYFESRYDGSDNVNLMNDYIWGLILEGNIQYKRKSRKTTFIFCRLSCIILNK